MLKGNDYLILSIILVLGISIYSYLQTDKFTNYVAPYAPPSQKGWWNRVGAMRFGYPYYSYWETFENPAPVHPDKKESPIMEYPPDTPAQADLSLRTPYHLLGDEMGPPREKESISCVNSRSCYATNFERMVDKVSNYRQFTNNFKRGYPDSCSAPYQELVLNFYKADPMSIPKNNTGGSVSEAAYN